jgi:aspartate ammonia-lyase
MAGSLVEATALSPYLGYQVTAELVKEALASRRPLREVVVARGLMDRLTLARLLRPLATARPQRLDRALQRRLQARPAYEKFKASFL